MMWRQCGGCSWKQRFSAVCPAACGSLGGAEDLYAAGSSTPPWTVALVMSVSRKPVSCS